MKIKSAFALLVFISSVNFVRAQVTTGGPDSFGYVWANSYNALGLAYKWKDIKDSNNLVHGLSDDNSKGPFNIGLHFNYYGVERDSIWIGSNGWISFDTVGNISAPFLPIPSSTSPNFFIAGMLSDLTFIESNGSPVPGAAAYLWSNQVDSAIVQYDSVPFWDSSASGYSGRNTFQIILSKAWGGNSITLQYKKLINSIPPYDLSNSGLKTGIQDSCSRLRYGLQVLSDTFPSDSSTVTFFYPNTLSTNNINNSGLSLGQNFPNPSKDVTVVHYTTPKSENVSFSIQNVLGEQIENFPIGNIAAGDHLISIDSRSYPAGVYFYTLSVNGASSTRKMVVSK